MVALAYFYLGMHALAFLWVELSRGTPCASPYHCGAGKQQGSAAGAPAGGGARPRAQKYKGLMVDWQEAVQKVQTPTGCNGQAASLALRRLMPAGERAACLPRAAATCRCSSRNACCVLNCLTRELMLVLVYCQGIGVQH